jgi:hypothetical protein
MAVAACPPSAVALLRRTGRQFTTFYVDCRQLKGEEENNAARSRKPLRRRDIFPLRQAPLLTSC